MDEFAELEKELFGHTLPEPEYEFPLLVGNREPCVILRPIETILLYLIFWPMAIGMTFGLVFLISPIIDFLQNSKHKREYENGVLNPDFLRGSGLVIFPDRSAELITKPNIPAYHFEADDITKLVHVNTDYGLGGATDHLQVYLHDFHALTLYGFNHREEKEIIEKLVSIYGIECEFEKVDESSRGGSGGG